MTPVALALLEGRETDPDKDAINGHLLAFHQLGRIEKRLYDAAVRVDFVHRTLRGSHDKDGREWTRERIAQLVLASWFEADQIPCDDECRKILRLPPFE